MAANRKRRTKLIRASRAIAVQHGVQPTVLARGYTARFARFRAPTIKEFSPFRRHMSQTVGQEISLEEVLFTRKIRTKQVA